MITATDVYNHTECPRRVYLNKHGDKAKKMPISAFREKLMKDGIQHEKEVIKSMKYAEVVYADQDEGFKMTYYLMSTGVPLIYHGILKYDGLIGEPDLLVKLKGRSKYGPYHYAPCDIKSSKEIKDEHKMQLMFYAHLLSKIQGNFPSISSIININKKDIEFKTSEERKVFERKLEEIEKIHEKKLSMDAILIPACAGCGWKDFCQEAAMKKKDLSLIYRMTRDQRELLISKGIKDIRALTRADSSKLGRNKGLNEKTIEKWKQQAKALISGKHITLKKPTFEKCRTEIFFDIEGEPALGVDYLYGALIKRGKNERYISFWADKPEDEEKAFKDFCKYLEGLKEFKIYHYASYEKTALKKLAKKYKVGKRLMNRIEKNMIDLFPIVTRSVVMPVISYSIKPVAKFLDFSWTSEEAGGAQSICWYSNWLETGNLSYKDALIEYNKNDCQAISRLKGWLAGLE